MQNVCIGPRSYSLYRLKPLIDAGRLGFFVVRSKKDRVGG